MKLFDKAKKYIEQSANNGGVEADVFKSFHLKNEQKERLDIEIRKGKAFVRF